MAVPTRNRVWPPLMATHPDHTIWEIALKRRLAAAEDFYQEDVDNKGHRCRRQEREQFQESRIQKLETQQQREGEADEHQVRIDLFVAHIGKNNRDEVKEQRQVAVVPFADQKDD